MISLSKSEFVLSPLLFFILGPGSSTVVLLCFGFANSVCCGRMFSCFLQIGKANSSTLLYCLFILVIKQNLSVP